MPDWRSDVIRLRLEEGMSWESLVDQYQDTFPGLSREQIRKKLYGVVRRSSQARKERAEDRRDGTKTITSSGVVNTSEGDPLMQIFEAKDRTPEILLKAHGLSEDEWFVVNYINNYWHAQKKGGGRLTLYQSKLTVKPLIEQISFEDIERFFKETTFDIRKPIVVPARFDPDGETLIINFADLHSGMYAWMAETGANYDVKIARMFFMRGVADILSRCPGRKFKKIILALLGDLLHTDNDQQSTTKGTLQQVDGRMPQVFTVTLDMLIETVDRFEEVAPVDVLYTRGNHDYLTGWTLIKSLEQAYKGDEKVFIDVSPDTQKYRVIGDALIGFLHGNMPEQNLSGWLQVIARRLGTSIKFMEILKGHDHEEKTKEIKQTKTNDGIVIRTIPSISNSSTWEHNEGYVKSSQAVICYVWDDKRGLRETWNCSM